jgi:hypothetical protein
VVQVALQMNVLMSRKFKSENLVAREMNLLVISLQIRVLPAAVQLVAATPIRIETIGHLMIRFGGRVGGGAGGGVGGGVGGGKETVSHGPQYAIDVRFLRRKQSFM